ncbi:MAG: NADH:ubiquinone reductase (Na(+)-transporting) subunit D [Planctomycetes bacterium]|nr:NADH:ubiquinone reductase (Na(+)-transporting) subunit D [Planctomycetota bacterium]
MPGLAANLKTFFWKQNPITCQVLGLCSALAVTTRVENALVMSIALVFVVVGSNLSVSLVRNITPARTRMIVEVLLIATFVIIFDQVLKAAYYSMSKQLGPYVGLIITNCIVMGRAEAFAIQNRPIPSIFDGVGNAFGYGFVLLAVAAFREIFGAGHLFGSRVLPAGYEPCLTLVLAPGAFIGLGLLVWIGKAIAPTAEGGN